MSTGNTNTCNSFPLFENSRAPTNRTGPEINAETKVATAPLKMGALTFTRFSRISAPDDGNGGFVAGKLEFADALSIEGDFGLKTVGKIKGAVSSTIINETLNGDLQHIADMRRLLSNTTLAIVHGLHNRCVEAYCVRGIAAGISRAKPAYIWNLRSLVGAPVFGKEEVLLGEDFRRIEEKAANEDIVMVTLRDRGNVSEGHMGATDARAAHELADRMLWRVTWNMVQVKDRALLERLLRTQGQAP